MALSNEAMDKMAQRAIRHAAVTTRSEWQHLSPERHAELHRQELASIRDDMLFLIDELKRLRAAGSY